jgi:hypothetical protein
MENGGTVPSVPLFLRIFAEGAFNGANVAQKAVSGRDGKPGLDHHFAQERGRFRMSIGGLHSDSDKPIRIIDGLPPSMCLCTLEQFEARISAIVRFDIGSFNS